jgi:hypothetical protein
MATECLDATARPVARLAHCFEESTYGVELSLARSQPVPIALVILDRTLKYVGGVYSNLNGAVSSRLDVTLYNGAALGNQAVLPN